MNTTKQHLLRALLLSGALALTAPQAAEALTAACTQINNRATVNYTIGAVAQPAINSRNGNNANADEATSFYVGVKVDLTVTKQDNSVPTFAPGATNATMNFLVTNNGNASMIYDLTAANKATGTTSPTFVPAIAFTDNFNAATVSVNGSGITTATTAAVAPGASLPVTVVITVPNTQVNNDLSVWSLIAQSKFTGTGTISVTTKNSTATGAQIGGATCSAAGPATTNIDVVTNDIQGTDDGAANDGASSDRDAVLVTAAGLTISKSSVVYWDPVNLFATPKAIPGAIVTYTVNIANAATAATASNIQVVDSLDAPITAGQVVFGGAVAGKYDDGVNVCPAGSGIWIQGSGCKTNVFLGNDGGSFNDPADPAVSGLNNRVVALVPAVAGGASVSVKYQVVIQ